MKFVLGSTVITAALALSACGGGQDPSAGQDSGATTISVGNFTTASQLPFMVGVEEGVFEEVGLDVETVGLTSGPAGISALQNNSIQVMPLGASVVAGGNQKGQELRIICGDQDGDWTSMWTGKDSDLADVAEAGNWKKVLQGLKGKVIGVNALGGTDENGVTNLLSAAGVKKSEVEFVSVGSGNRAVASLNQGDVDALYAYPFNDLVAEQEGARRLIHVPTDLPGEMKDSLSAVWFSSATWLKDNGETAKAFCDGMDKSLEFTKDPDNIDAVSAVMSKDFDLTDRELAKTFVDGNLEYLSTDINCTSIETMIGLAVEQGTMQDGEYTDCESNLWDGANIE